ncbi:TerC family protein [Gorillibacterium massiliense]|uniref:TerC family protein n=1 Tax=Gorillibacterium massiliense TaxID=1280390 RepID=UPI0004B9B61E|nr:TerC family protein [Gorillibacterium massiliense]
MEFWPWLLLFAQIILINFVLSGDNAVVIALASKNLPVAQRKQAMWWGAFGAVGLRLILTIAALALLSLPYIKAIGSFLLLYIAIKLLLDDGEEKKVGEAASVGKAIRTIILADFVMSLDNVLAVAAAAGNNLPVIICGIMLSIPIIVWGSTLAMGLLHRFPVLVYLGAGILGFTAGEMLLGDTQIAPMINADLLHTALPALYAIFVVLAGFLGRRWKLRSRQSTM